MCLAGLHAHDEYSLLDGAGTATQHAVAARDAGYVALANTNHATLAGSLHHMRACREAGILPISGVEAYYRPNRKVQGQKEWRYNYDHITLIAKDLCGWRNIMRIVSESHHSGFYEKACCDDEILEKYSEGVVCLTGCIGGRLAKSILGEDPRQAEAWIRQLRRIFKDDLFAEIMPHDLDQQRVANIEVVRIAERHGIPIVATADAHYPSREWAPTREVLMMIRHNSSLKHRQARRDEGLDVFEFTLDTYFQLSREQILDLFARHHPGISREVAVRSVDDTLAVAGLVKPFLVDRSEKMPAVSFPGVDDNAAHLRRLAYEGLARRGYADDRAYKDQVDYELGVISKLESVDQILLAWDVVSWAKSDRPVPKRDRRGNLVFEGRKEPMMVGPGRGSAAGSLVCNAIDLTNVNPIKHRLLFERFMNPLRQGKPDIDIDFSPTDVDMVEAYVKVVHGKDRVVDVIAHSTFGPRAALSDAGRVLNVPFDHIKAATKTIDDQERGALSDIRVLNPAVDRLATEQPRMWEEACRIQGMVARKSEHAGALLILPGPYEEYIPVERTGGQKGKLLTAFGERGSVEHGALLTDYGFVGKLDILRVAELTKQGKAVELIRQSTGETIDLDALPVHDDPYAVEPEVMRGFHEGWLVGIFQFSATASKLTRQIKPDNIFDLSAINALIRPGPRGAGLDQQYALRKNGVEDVAYWHPVLSDYLDYSYGILAFQEQLIEVVHHLGGLSRGQADIFRKIASKLYRNPEYAREVMGQWEVPIKAGMAERGLSPDEADDVWTNLLSFSDYSFNLAHASGYSLLAYRDMWLKTHYPREFYAAFLSCGLSQVTKKRVIQKAEAVREARHMGLKIMPPDINESGRDYTVVERGIRLGLESIKNVGPAACAAIEEHRPFESMGDVERRCPATAVNVKTRASLVMAGACDRWGMRDDYTEEFIDERERDLLGMSLTSVYSIAAYADAIEGRFWTEDEFDEASDGTRVAVVGEVTNVKEYVDKRGGTMAFVDLVYGPNHYNCTVFASLYEIYKDVIDSRRPLLVMGAKNTHNGKTGIRVESLPVLDDADFVPPICDLSTWVEMIGDESEQLAGDSVYPEDLAEALAPS